MQDLFHQYKADCSFLKSLAAYSKSQFTPDEFQKLQGMVNSCVEFLTAGETRARHAYEKVLEASQPSDNMMELSWDLIGYEELLKQNQELSKEIPCIVNLVCGQQQIVKACIVKLCTKLQNYFK